MASTKKIRVLLFPAGTEIACEIWDALKWQKDIELFGASSMHDHSDAMYIHLANNVPYLGEPGLIDALNCLINCWSIDVVYPARDDVQLFLVEHSDELRAQIASAPLETVRICRSKSATYKALGDASFVPKIYGSIAEVDSFPVFAKPDAGEGSKGATLIKSASEMEHLASGDRPYVFCEYLPGAEWTVDCFTNSDGKLCICLPRVRERTKAGIAVRSSRVTDAKLVDSIWSIAETINGRLTFVGAWFFQLKARADGMPVLMEASPRIPGTMGLSRNLGINFPLLTIYQFMGYTLEIPEPLTCRATVERALIGRYRLGIEYGAVYIDYDDTITMADKVNPLVMLFLFQCRNQGKRIVLLTHHDDEVLGELDADMARRGVARTLFDEIIHLEPHEEKSTYIDSGARPILIDDSYSERSRVAERCGIPVFDISSIESLIDWRA